MTALAYLAIGCALGAGSSVVPGPCGVAIVRAAERSRRRAVAIAIGAGLGDLAYATLGLSAFGPTLAHAAVLKIVGGVVLVLFGMGCLWARAPRAGAAPRWNGVLVGFTTLVANPGALVAWSTVGIELAGASTAALGCAALGIGTGSMAWFVGEATVAARARCLLGAHMRGLVRAMGCALVVGGVCCVIRAYAG